jgi:hypothetical protein
MGLELGLQPLGRHDPELPKAAGLRDGDRQARPRDSTTQARSDDRVLEAEPLAKPHR